MVRNAPAALLALVVVGCSSSQHAVKGLVKDRVTGSPVEGAMVQVEGVGQAVTDPGGLYTIRVPRSRTPRAVYVEARGYFKFSEFRVFFENTPEHVLNFELLAEDDVRRGLSTSPGGPRWRPQGRTD